MEHRDWSRHLAEIGRTMRGQPFWKAALFGLQCLRRQWPVYERLCVGREWGNAKAVSRVLERFWRAIPTGYAIGPSYLAAIEDSTVVPEEDWDTLAVEFVQNLEILFTIFEEKDRAGAVTMAEQNLEFLSLYLDWEDTGWEGIHPLMAAEMEVQAGLARKIAVVPNKDKRAFAAAQQSAPVESILQDHWFRDYPDYKPIRRKRSAPGGDGLRFRTPYQKSRPGDKAWRQVMDREAAMMDGLAQYQASGWKPEAVQDYHTRNFAQGNYRDFYRKMYKLYFDQAEDLYLRDRPMEEVLRALYQAAESLLLCTELARGDAGAERPLGFGRTVAGYAMLIYRYEEAAALLEEGGSPCLQFLCRLLRGLRDGETEALLPACEAAADPIYCGADWNLIRALWSGEPEGVRAALVKMLRAIRAVENLYLEVFPQLLILAARAAAGMGLSVRPIHVSELPEALIGTESPFRPEDSRPFGVEALGPLPGRPAPDGPS